MQCCASVADDGPTLDQNWLNALALLYTKQGSNMIWCWANVADNVPTLYQNWVNVVLVVCGSPISVRCWASVADDVPALCQRWLTVCSGCHTHTAAARPNTRRPPVRIPDPVITRIIPAHTAHLTTPHTHTDSRCIHSPRPGFASSSSRPLLPSALCLSSRGYTQLWHGR